MIIGAASLLLAAPSRRAAAQELPAEGAERLAAYSAFYAAQTRSDPRDVAEGLCRLAFDFASKAERGAGETLIPAGTRFAGIELPGRADGAREIRFLIDFPDAFIASDAFTEYRMYLIGGFFDEALFDEAYNVHMMYARDPATGDFVDIQKLLPVEEVVPWNPEPDYASMEMSRRLGKPEQRDGSERATMPVINPGRPQGALTGKTVFINQSHGWFDDYLGSLARWRVQRGLAFGINEDTASPEFINMYVLPTLRNAGAKVMTVRESDFQTNMVIVDNNQATNGSNGSYAETGTWSTSSINGFVHKTGASWNGVTVNPFNQGSGQNRLSSGLTSGAATATATWTANIPADGYYNVYASWAPFSARAHDAQYLVRHSGGETEYLIDQTIDGYTWYLLGNFYFEAAAPASERQVVLTNHSTDSGATNVSADAVRWGGGMGDVARHTHGVSGRPRWEEEAVIHLQWDGFGYSGLSYTGDDDESGGWADRPQYAGWEHSGKDGSVEDAIYFAWHTNADGGAGAARGVSSFHHSTATQASIDLQTIMHNTAYSHVAGLWFPGWTVRGKNEGNYGENNQGSLGTGLPGFLLEGLFHNNSADATGYGEPQFRADYARALTQGIINYFEARDSITLTNPPETPTHLRVEAIAPDTGTGNGSIRVSWSAPPNNTNNTFYGGAATSYLVYRSDNGFGFDNGATTAATSMTFNGISADRPVYFRVASANAGGQSFPTETLVAQTGAGSPILIVQGFDRNQRSQVPTTNITNIGSGVLRVDPRNFQAFNYVIEHAEALAAAASPDAYSVSSTSNEALIAGSVALSSFDGAIWIGGEESVADETFATAEQTLMSTFLGQSGKGLFVTGAEIAWDLDSQGSTPDRTFINSVLRGDYVGDDAGTYNIAAASSGIFAGLPAFNFNPSSGARYDAEFPDRLAPLNGASSVLTYSGGTADTAAVARIDLNGGSVIFFGFPFETISSAAVRTQIMGDVADALDWSATTSDPTDVPLLVAEPGDPPAGPGEDRWYYRNWSSRFSGTSVGPWLVDATSGTTRALANSLRITGGGNANAPGSFGASTGEWINPGSPLAQFAAGNLYLERANLSMTAGKSSSDSVRIFAQENSIAAINQTYVINSSETVNFGSGAKDHPFLPNAGVGRDYLHTIEPLSADLTGKNDGNPSNDLFYLLGVDLVDSLAGGAITASLGAFSVVQLESVGYNAGATPNPGGGNFGGVGGGAFDGSDNVNYGGWRSISDGIVPLALVGGSTILRDPASRTVGAGSIDVGLAGFSSGSPSDIQFVEYSNFAGAADVDSAEVVADGIYRVDMTLQGTSGASDSLIPDFRLRVAYPIPTFSLEYVVTPSRGHAFPTEGVDTTLPVYFTAPPQFAPGADPGLVGQEDDLQMVFGPLDSLLTDGTLRLTKTRVQLLGLSDPNVDY